MPFIGNTPDVNFTSFAKQTITGNGGTSYTLSHAVANENEVEIFVNNVRQEGGSGKAYTVNGTALTMTGNVANTDSFYVIFLGKALQTTVPPDGSVTNAKVADNAGIAGSKLGTGAVLQVKHFQLTSTQTETSISANTDRVLTNFEVSITPKSTSSIIMLDANIMYETTASAWDTGWFFYRNTNKLAGDSASSRKTCITVGHLSLNGDNTSSPERASLRYIDSPSSTSAITYKVGFSSQSTANMFINRTINDTDNIAFERMVSLFTATEIGG